MANEPEKPIKVTRTPIPNRVRFEVFKRDKFTCQYCGATAPDVVLECDHVEPAALGGTADILNLITSCRPCNSGKGAIPLSDHSALDKQRASLADLEERRQQIEMMVRWRDELRGLASDTVQRIADYMGERSHFMPNEAGIADIRRWIRSFSVDEILRASDEAFDTYLMFEGDKATANSWNTAFGRIPGIVRTQREEGERPYLRKLYYIQGIIRNRSGAKRYNCIDYLEHLHLAGAPLDRLERSAKRMDELADFEGPWDEWLDSIGRPF